jgi:hypothetical protein
MLRGARGKSVMSICVYGLLVALVLLSTFTLLKREDSRDDG